MKLTRLLMVAGIAIVCIYVFSSCKGKKRDEARTVERSEAVGTREGVDQISKKGKCELTLTKDWSIKIMVPSGNNTFRMDPLQEPVELEALVNGFRSIKLSPTNHNGWVSSGPIDGSFVQYRISPEATDVDQFKTQITLR